MDQHTYDQLLRMIFGETDPTQPAPTHCVDLACLMGVHH